MDFIKSLLPAEWNMRLFEPETDTAPGAHIYLHITETDSVYRLKTGASRYAIVELLKELHDDALDTTEFASRLTAILHINLSRENEIAETFQSFSREEAIFMGSTRLIIEHDKNEAGAWVTTFIKVFDKAKRTFEEKPIAYITNSVELNWTV